MLFDAGILLLCRAVDQSEPGGMPCLKLELVSKHWFGERTIGYGRQYAAMGVNEKIDLLARIWEDRSARIGMYVIIDDVQYRIGNVQHLMDENGLRVTELSLERLEEKYEVNRENA